MPESNSNDSAIPTAAQDESKNENVEKAKPKAKESTEPTTKKEGKSKKKKAAAAAAAAAQEEKKGEVADGNGIPNGCAPMMISMKNMEKYELKTGSGLKDTVEYKEFDYESVIEEVNTIGFYSDFHDFKKQLDAYKGDKILVIADPKEKYGQNWYICLTEEAHKEQLDVLLAEQRKKEEIERARLEEEARKKAEEEAELNAVYDDKPIIPASYISESAQESFEQVVESMIHPERPLLKMSITRKRKEFGSVCKFNDRDAEQSGLVEFRQHKDPNFELKKKLVDTASQACASWTQIWLPISPWSLESDIPCETAIIQEENSIQTGRRDVSEYPEGLGPYRGEMSRFQATGTQTSNFRKVNKTIQYESIDMSAENAQEEFELQEVATFLDQVCPIVEAALQQNETVDVFADEFALLGQDEPVIGNKGENTIKELRTFTDLIYSKNKSIPCLNWHPRSQNVIAVACTERLTFEERVEQSGIATSAFILIWNFSDLIHPQIVLESPYECTQFAFCPSQPHIIAGGCITGQVVLWDISTSQELLIKKQQAGKLAKSNTQEGDPNDASKEETADAAGQEIETDDEVSAVQGEDNDDLPPVKPIAISAVDNSHRRAVTDICWVNDCIEIDARGEAIRSEDKKSHQFITCAGDNQILVWDIRYKEQANKRSRGTPNTTSLDKAPSKKVEEEIQWNAHFRAIFSNSEGKIEIKKLCLRGLSRTKLGLKDVADDIIRSGNKSTEEQSEEDQAMQAQKNALRKSAIFSCSTDDGQLIFADWMASGYKSGGSMMHSQFGGEADASQGISENIVWIERDHFGTCTCLRRSPFFPEIILSVGAYSFNIWLEGKPHCLMESPFSTVHLTCGEWSPTRPGVLMIARADGHLEIWDFTDQSHRPHTSVAIASCPIDSLQFRTNQGSGSSSIDDENGEGESVDADKMQLLAAGDEQGNLHILEIPRNLRRKISNESNMVKKFWLREIERLNYVLSRRNSLTEAPIDEDAMETEVTNMESKHNIALDGQIETTPSNENRDDGANSMNNSGEDLTVDEERYRALEQEFILKLGLDKEDLETNSEHSNSRRPKSSKSSRGQSRGSENAYNDDNLMDGSIDPLEKRERNASIEFNEGENKM